MPQELLCDDGEFTLIDDEFADRVQYFNLRANDGKGKDRPNATAKYIRFSNNTGKGKTERLHRVIMEWILGRKLKSSEIVDHKNGNTRDNTKENLRVATKRQNSHNTKKRGGTNMGSDYKGVRYTLSRGHDTRVKPWYARIKVNGAETPLGYFETEREAAQAYNEAALKYFGEFARLNLLD